MEGEERKVELGEEKGKKGKGFLIGGIVLIVIILGAGGYFAFARKSDEPKSNVPVASNNGSSENSKGQNSRNSSTNVSWMMTADGTYQATGTPPSCPSPLVLPLPTDLTKVVSILYPGQYRGTDYKPHGGLRFNDGDNNQTVTAPLDATVVDGSRYTVNGEVQYLFDFINPCGIKYRLGHLRTLSPSFAALADTFPAPQEMDSRTTQINPPATVKAGDTIATAVGLLGAGNAFFDYGVFDLRQQNEISKTSLYQTAHSNDKDLAWHGICWLDNLSSSDTTAVKALPATSPGSMSDYCAGATPATTSSSPIPAAPASTTSTTTSTSSTSSTSGSGSGSGTGGGGGNGTGGGTGGGQR